MLYPKPRPKPKNPLLLKKSTIPKKCSYCSSKSENSVENNAIFFATSAETSNTTSAETSNSSSDDLKPAPDEALKAAFLQLVNEMKKWELEVTVFEDIITAPDTQFMEKTEATQLDEEMMYEGAFYLIDLNEDFDIIYRFYIPPEIASELKAGNFYIEKEFYKIKGETLKSDTLSEAAQIGIYELSDAAVSTKCPVCIPSINHKNGGRFFAGILRLAFTQAAEVYKFPESVPGLKINRILPELKADRLWYYNIQRKLARAPVPGLKEKVIPADYLFQMDKEIEGGAMYRGGFDDASYSRAIADQI